MIEKPEIDDEKIISVLNNAYSIQASHVEFLPIGNDAHAFAYRVDAKDDVIYFLKARRESSHLAGCLVPRLLKNSGIEQVIAPLYTKSQQLSAALDEFSIILYPFIPGKDAMQVGMTDAQWIEFGTTLKQIHTTQLPGDQLQFIERESFIPKGGSLVKALHGRVYAQDYEDPYQGQLASLWKENSETIQTILDRTEEIGRYLQHSDPELFLCHADIHTANIMITPDGHLFIVDWDGALFAPRERDLLFVAGLKEESLFFQGYGSVEINLPTLAYYRYEWCVQELADYGQRVFLTEDASESTKQDAVERFIELFAPGDVIEAAWNTPIEI